MNQTLQIAAYDPAWPGEFASRQAYADSKGEFIASVVDRAARESR